jgi:hypothetical protein
LGASASHQSALVMFRVGLAALGIATAFFWRMGTAEAELLDDVDRVVALWPGPNALVERLGPLFLEQGRALALDVAPTRGVSGGCTSVLILGAASLKFAVRSPDPLVNLHQGLDGGADDVEPPQPLRSSAGLLSLTRCGDRRRELTALHLEPVSPRGTVELLVLRGGSPRELATILPERVSGPAAAMGDPGRAIEPEPLAERVARAEQRARADGAERVIHVAFRASSMGTGEFVLKLSEGCHRLEVMAEVPTTVPRRVTDVDVELRDVEEPGVVRRDRADTPDGRLAVCVGEPKTMSLKFSGASGAVPVTVADAVWPIPAVVPQRWGERARAGFAWALARRHAPVPTQAPVVEALGAQGITSVAVDVLPGGCYLAAVALVRGEAQAIRLTADVEGRLAHDDAVDQPEGAAVAFCATISTVARLEVHTRGSGPWWVLAVWPMGQLGP